MQPKEYGSGWGVFRPDEDSDVLDMNSWMLTKLKWDDQFKSPLKEWWRDMDVNCLPDILSNLVNGKSKDK